MRHMLLASAAFLSLAVPVPSLALTPDEVWQEWSAWLQTQPGVDVPKAQAQEDGSLLVNGITATSAHGSDRYSLTVPELRLIPAGEAVQVSLPKPLTLAFKEGHTASLDASGLETVLEDAPTPGLLGHIAMTAGGRLSYRGTFALPETATGSAPEDTPPTPGDEAPSLTGAFEGSIEDMALSITGGTSDNQAGLSFQAAKGDLQAQGDGPTGQPFSVHAEAADINTTLDVEHIDLFAGQDPVAAISKGANISFQATQGAGSYALKNIGDGDWNKWTTAQVEAGIDRDGLHYTTGVDGFESGGKLPHAETGTFGMAAERLDMSLTLPLFAQTGAQIASFATNATQVLMTADGPNIPAALTSLQGQALDATLDVEADIELDEDLWPTTMAAAERDTPPEGRIKEVRLNYATLDIEDAHAEATGTLDFTGDTFADAQPGAGQADVSLHNATRLLDLLTESGAITPAQRTQGEMVLRMFAKTGETDPLTYSIVQESDGGLRVNDHSLR